MLYCRLYSEDAASTNGGYRSASFCIELRDTSSGFQFMLPAYEVRKKMSNLRISPSVAGMSRYLTTEVIYRCTSDCIIIVVHKGDRNSTFAALKINWYYHNSSCSYKGSIQMIFVNSHMLTRMPWLGAL